MGLVLRLKQNSVGLKPLIQTSLNFLIYFRIALKSIPISLSAWPHQLNPSQKTI